MKYIILSDNQDITRIGIESILQKRIRNSHNYKIFTAKNKRDLITLLTEYPQSSIVIDYTLSDFSSSNELLILSQRYPTSSWLLFSEDLSNEFLKLMTAYDLPFSILLKNCAIEEIEKGINAILNQSIYICESIKAHIKTLKKRDSVFSEEILTHTEKEVLREIALGKTTKEIAYDRNLSFHTIITHRKNTTRSFINKRSSSRESLR